MTHPKSILGMVLFAALLVAPGAVAQQSGSIRGLVMDKDFDSPAPGVQVQIVETGAKTTTTDQGNYVFSQVAPGKYTVLFKKEGYVQWVKADVVVTAGQLTNVDAALAGDFTDMEEFVVQDVLQAAPGSDAALLQLRLDSPQLLNSISADLISRAGASDAAGALRLVAGATVQDGKSAVIRGLPDRYVSSQINGVRLPTADEDKRAVELDQFPAAVIESIQVSKTFTPDQQGDASGGAVNLLLKGIPDQPFFVQTKVQSSFNTNVTGRNDFLSYDRGGLEFWGRDDGSRDIQFDNIGSDWTGAVGVSRESAPIDYKWSIATGGSFEVDDGIKVGGFASLFYKRDSSFYDDGIDDSYWVESPGAGLTPRALQGSVEGGDFKTALFDVTQARQAVQWGTLATLGLETEDHKIHFTYLYTRTTDDLAILAEDTRGKAYFFPGYDPADPTTPGHAERDAAPYKRLESLVYTERSTDTFQIGGDHTLPFEGLELGDAIKFKKPSIDWTVALSSAGLDQPDKRQFGSLSYPEREPFPGFIQPAQQYPATPAANINLGNLQRIYKTIEEESIQYFVNLELPFEQWSGDEGYLKFGVFHDEVSRTFRQETFANFGDSGAFFEGPFEEFWSASFPNESHPISESLYDVDYDGTLEVGAWYGMLKMPVITGVTLTGGVRVESTDIGIVNDPEQLATWFPPGSVAPTQLNPGDADVDFSQEDVLPSLSLELKPWEELVLRAAWSKTVARQTFKELTPIIQQEFLGGPIFIGNPDLRMSDVTNYDVRLDWRPYQGGLVSFSWFKKDIKDPIEYVQRPTTIDFTTAVNYPKGTLQGIEIELQQDLGHFVDEFEGLRIGANATFINSKVYLPDDEIAGLNLPNILAPITTRDMTGAPENLYNFFLTYDIEDFGTQLAVFYTIQGDTLLAGGGEADGNFVPSIYAKRFDTLNLSISQKIGEYFKLKFQAKNLTNPKIQRVYRSEFIGDDVIRSSYSKGIEFSLELSAEFRF